MVFSSVGLKCCWKRRGKRFPPGRGLQSHSPSSCQEVLLRFSWEFTVRLVVAAGTWDQHPARAGISLGAQKQGAFDFGWGFLGLR